MSEQKLTRRVQIDAMGAGYSETPPGVFVHGPGMEELDADHLTVRQWNKIKRDVQTGKLDNAKVKAVIKAQQ